MLENHGPSECEIQSIVDITVLPQVHARDQALSGIGMPLAI